MSDTIIDISHITKKFGRLTVLDDVSYQVRKGSVFALLGENGAGKTTTIRMLLGLCEPDSGSRSVFGLDCKQHDLRIRQSVGYVPEQPVLYEWMTVGEIGRFSASFYPDGFLTRYYHWLTEYDLLPDAKIRSLSKGQKAKVSLSVALAHDPELLILDEPTSGLDPMVRREFLESMVDRAATGRTVFLSSHQIGEVERVADTVAIMKKSKILLVESLETLKSRSHLITMTLKEDATWEDVLLEQVVQQQADGRERRLLGHNLREDAEKVLKEHPNVTRYEIKKPTLEEIFVAYMK
ncbi:MAG: ABC transporter ATP-binding protein [Planctomycetaceae bacterium]|nr:ABC transporter ATP-binding protein [Planctomycetaceae bacterium]